MMGEYLLYYRGVCLAVSMMTVSYSSRWNLLLSLLEHPVYQLPYPGAKAMLYVEELGNADLLCQLVQALYPVLPEPKRKK